MLLHCSSLNNRSCIPFLFSIRTRRRNSNVVVVLVTRASRDTTTKPTMNVNMKPGARLCVVGRSLPTSFLWYHISSYINIPLPFSHCVSNIPTALNRTLVVVVTFPSRHVQLASVVPFLSFPFGKSVGYRHHRHRRLVVTPTSGYSL